MATLFQFFEQGNANLSLRTGGDTEVLMLLWYFRREEYQAT